MTCALLVLCMFCARSIIDYWMKNVMDAKIDDVSNEDLRESLFLVRNVFGNYERLISLTFGSWNPPKMKTFRLSLRIRDSTSDLSLVTANQPAALDP